MGLGLGILVFLSSGLFLGWSLGANDAANVFGTAVGSRMVKFRTAAAICAVCVVLGAVLAGGGTTHTLGRLGAVNALGGSFTVALAAALATFVMTRAGLPISTSQAVVGAIIGWNLYTASLTDTTTLIRIVSTWVLCPVLAAGVAAGLFGLLRRTLLWTRPHLLRQDAGVRIGLIVVGAFGSFSLGANNIANVVGMFVIDNPFRPVSVAGLFELSANQQLFLLGGLAIALGVATYSGRVMRTVGGGLMRLSPEAALVVVMAQAVVLFLFASTSLEHWLASHGLPTFPLVPVSSSQAVVGAIIGLGLLRGGRNIRYRVLGEIGLGWLLTPVVAGVLSFFLLFFVENVFDQTVARPVTYRIDRAVVESLSEDGVPTAGLDPFQDREFHNALRLQARLVKRAGLSDDQARTVVRRAEVAPVEVDLAAINLLVDADWLTLDQIRAVRSLAGRRFEHPWQFRAALENASPLWREREDTALNRDWNRDVREKIAHLEDVFRTQAEAEDDER